jgi:hypothetical protein
MVEKSFYLDYSGAEVGLTDLLNLRLGVLVEPPYSLNIFY